MHPKQTTLSLADGTQATLTLSDPMTPERVAILEHALPAILRAMQHEARPTSDAGAVEYDSWLDAGAIEYASWCDGR